MESCKNLLFYNKEAGFLLVSFSEKEINIYSLNQRRIVFGHIFKDDICTVSIPSDQKILRVITNKGNFFVFGIEATLKMTNLDLCYSDQYLVKNGDLDMYFPLAHSIDNFTFYGDKLYFMADRYFEHLMVYDFGNGQTSLISIKFKGGNEAYQYFIHKYGKIVEIDFIDKDILQF